MKPTPFPEGVSSRGMGVNLPIPGTTGTIFYVNSVTGSASYDGLDPSSPLATLDDAIGHCTADEGDVIIVMPGHAETTGAAITADIAGISIIGLGNGLNRPAFTIHANVDGIDVTADDVRIENLYFPAATAAHTATINSSASHTVIRNCEFNEGQYEIETITLAAGANFCLIEGNRFYITADGPDAAIEVESTITSLKIIDNLFNAGASTYAYDTGAINSGQVHLGCYVKGNRGIAQVVNAGANLIVFSADSTGILEENEAHTDGGTLANMFNPGMCGCINNSFTNDIAESGSPAYPQTTAT